MATKSDLEKALDQAKDIRCPKCKTGLITRDLCGDYSCFNCGFVLYISNQPSILFANNIHIQQPSTKTRKYMVQQGLDFSEDTE